MRRKLCLPVRDVCPLGVLEERDRGHVKGVGVVEAAPANPRTSKDHDVGQAVDPLYAKAFQARRPQIAAQVPGCLGEVLIGETATGLDDVDAIALLGQP